MSNKKKKSYLKTRIAMGVDFNKHNPMNAIVEDFTLNLKRKSLNDNYIISMYKSGQISGAECLQRLK